jgi:hypothetical protein
MAHDVPRVPPHRAGAALRDAFLIVEADFPAARRQSIDAAPTARG